jgi:hypothetical protein
MKIKAIRKKTRKKRGSGNMINHFIPKEAKTFDDIPENFRGDIIQIISTIPNWGNLANHSTRERKKEYMTGLYWIVNGEAIEGIDEETRKEVFNEWTTLFNAWQGNIPHGGMRKRRARKTKRRTRKTKRRTRKTKRRTRKTKRRRKKHRKKTKRKFRN